MCMGTLLIINYMAFLDSSYEKDEPNLHAMAWFFNYMFAYELCFYAYDSLRKHDIVRSIYMHDVPYVIDIVHLVRH